MTLHGVPRDARRGQRRARVRPLVRLAARAARGRSSCARSGSTRPARISLYAGSSDFIAGDETAFVREWLGRLRAARDASVRELGVLVRPHPQNASGWRTFDLERRARRDLAARRRVADRRRARDRLLRLAPSRGRRSFGINTSALVEAAIAAAGRCSRS